VRGEQGGRTQEEQAARHRPRARHPVDQRRSEHGARERCRAAQAAQPADESDVAPHLRGHRRQEDTRGRHGQHGGELGRQQRPDAAGQREVAGRDHLGDRTRAGGVVDAPSLAYAGGTPR
jgi:hypothetical protein